MVQIGFISDLLTDSCALKHLRLTRCDNPPSTFTATKTRISKSRIQQLRSLRTIANRAFIARREIARRSVLLGRPTCLSADFGFTAILLSIFFYFSPPTLRARWTELNQNQPHARKWVRFENACPKSGRAANGTQPNFAKRWTVNRANTLSYKRRGPSPPKKNWGQKPFTFVRFFHDFQT